MSCPKKIKVNSIIPLFKILSTNYYYRFSNTNSYVTEYVKWSILIVLLDLKSIDRPRLHIGILNLNTLASCLNLITQMEISVILIYIHKV